jgi:anaerobic dimethyl sulfoxide reductase subunit C (anchor subunit)
VFTLALQLSTALVLLATLFDGGLLSGMDFSLVRVIALIGLSTAVLGTLTSLLHLGRPHASWRALLNLRSSVLSHEVLITGLFLAGLGWYGFCWWTELESGRFAAGIVVSLLGLAAVVLSSMVYLVPTQPVWNSWTIPCSFVSTTALMAGFVCRVVLPPDAAAASVARCVFIVAAGAWLLATLQMFYRFARTIALPSLSARLAVGISCLAVLSLTVWMTGGLASRAFDVMAGTALIAGVVLQRREVYCSARLPEF